MKATKRPQPAREAASPPMDLKLAGATTFEVEAAGDESNGTKLPRFRMVAYTGSPMRVGGWRYPVVIDLAGLAIPSQSRPIRFGHDPIAGVGHTDSIRVEQGQLLAGGVVSRDTPAARAMASSAWHSDSVAPGGFSSMTLRPAAMAAAA